MGFLNKNAKQVRRTKEKFTHRHSSHIGGSNSCGGDLGRVSLYSNPLEKDIVSIHMPKLKIIITHKISLLSLVFILLRNRNQK
jgi:hypothetical protein